MLLAERLAARSAESIPSACNGWAETQAAYRFLANERVDWESILEPHAACTLERMAPHPTLLCLQDTSELNFNGQSIAGMGPLSYETLGITHALPLAAPASPRPGAGYWAEGRPARIRHENA